MIKYETIKQLAHLHPHKPALCDGAKIISWQELSQGVFKLMESLTKVWNFSSEAPGLYLSENSADIVMLGAAFSSLGIPLQGLDHSLSVKNLTQLIRQLNVEAVFISRPLRPSFLELEKVCKVYEIESFVEHSASMMLEGASVYSETNIKPFRSYAFTSGTTGIPKIVYRSSSFDKRRFEYLAKRYHFTGEDVHLACLPMHHVGTSGWLRLFMNLGCTTVIHNYVNAYQLCEIIHSSAITTTLMSARMLQQMAESLDHKTTTEFLPSLRFIMTGGKNFPHKVKTEVLAKLGDILHEYYGTTETGINALIDPQETKAKPESVGREFEGNEILVLDAENAPVKTGVIGRLAIHSYMTMDAYINHSADFIEINNKKFLLTADYGYKDPQGYLFITKRGLSHKSHSLNYYSMENAVLNLPYVADALVTESDEDKVINVRIVPKKYHPQRILGNDIQELSRKYGFKDALVHIVPQLDYTATGKIKLSPISTSLRG